MTNAIQRLIVFQFVIAKKSTYVILMSVNAITFDNKNTIELSEEIFIEGGRNVTIHKNVT